MNFATMCENLAKSKHWYYWHLPQFSTSRVFLASPEFWADVEREFGWDKNQHPTLLSNLAPILRLDSIPVLIVSGLPAGDVKAAIVVGEWQSEG